MIKRIIFDVDNTLIIWKKEYISALEKVMKEYNLHFDSKIIDDIISSLEYKYATLSKEILLQEINSNCHLNLDIEFINKLFEEQGKLAYEDKDVINTLRYLNNKYELVILTNYFTEVQTKRLEKAGILKYFKKIYGGDSILLKPRFEAFSKACGNLKKEECLMVGDNYDFDIRSAFEFGIKVIACDYYNNLPSSDKYIKITKFTDLKDIL